MNSWEVLSDDIIRCQTSPHLIAQTIGCENNRKNTQTITLTLKTKGNIVLDDHLN